MTITTDNYELYFYQYAEGELDAAERAAVEAFAAQHPQLAEELALYDPDLKLAESPMPCPNKESLLHPERRVLPLWRWAAAASVAAVLIGGAWLFWPSQSGEVADPEALMAQWHPVDSSQPSVEMADETVRHSIGEAHAQPSLALAKSQPASVATPTAEATLPPVSAAPQEDLQPQTIVEEPVLLAQTDQLPAEAEKDTVVIEYIDLMMYPEVEVAQAEPAGSPSLIDRYRNLRSRVSNTIRDYAYKSYAETRGELLAMVNN